MLIFNRWGEHIYTTNSLDKPWNGIPEKATVVAENGVYVYVITVTDNLNKKHKHKGHFSLIR